MKPVLWGAGPQRINCLGEGHDEQSKHGQTRNADGFGAGGPETLIWVT